MNKKTTLSYLNYFLNEHAEQFDFDYIDNARANYDYNNRQVDSIEHQISPENHKELSEEIYIDLKIEYETRHKVSRMDEEPFHDIEMISIDPVQIIFHLGDNVFDLSNDKKAIKTIKKFIKND